jgi:monofunctional biosynthetic peptidoglycan transglycosylase
MMTSVAQALPAMESNDEATLLLADYAVEQSLLDWFVVNDNVMGGRSEGGFRIAQGELFFGGSTNTRGGGFSSIRTAPLQLDLSSYQGVRLKVLGDGRRYTWRITTDARWRGRRVSYWAEFDTQQGEWSTIDIPFSNFVPQFRGVRLDGPDVDPARISGMGLMIYDKQDGPFELRLESVHAYGAQKPFAIAHYQWQKRVLVVSASDAEDDHLVSLQGELADMQSEFSDRDLELVVLLDSGTSLAGHRKLTATEVEIRCLCGATKWPVARRFIHSTNDAARHQVICSSGNRRYHPVHSGRTAAITGLPVVTSRWFDRSARCVLRLGYRLLFNRRTLGYVPWWSLRRLAQPVYNEQCNPARGLVRVYRHCNQGCD